MNIPNSVGWKLVNENLPKLNVIGNNHISFGFPPETPDTKKQEIEDFFYSFGKLLETTSQVTKNKPTEWFVYKECTYEHLLMPEGTVDKPFFHIEIDVNNTDEEIKEIFPKSWEEQPHMFWLTISKDFLGILWAVIITNKRCQ